MRIEELILEGFKSYPVRTTITGWDPSFNAITGLNGSGKSNILDAICFVLGITNMTSVRANNLMDLIYKRGQAGVTKASVTIVFNNSDRATAPVGFETVPQITVTRQIAVGNTSKYLLNGHKSTLQALQNLFQSVQLNINNPNFLIMQGKITKVLNMRPAEILGMVEEAAGTRMFEDRKEKNQKIMAKKIKKVEELAALLKEEIEPKLEKLRQEKREYLAYQKATSELERLTRLVKAYEWTLAMKKAETAKQELEARKEAVEGGKRDVERCKEEQGKMEVAMKDIQKKRDKELAKGSKSAALADTVNELERELVKLKTQLEMQQGTLADETKRIEAAGKGVTDAQKAVIDKRQASEESMSRYATEKEAYDSLVTGLEKAEELLQTLVTGLSANTKEDGEATGGYMGQLAEAKNRLVAAGTEAEQAKVMIGVLERDLKEKEPKAKKAAKDGEGLTKEFAAAKKRLEELQSSIGGMKFDEARQQEMMRLHGEHSEKIAGLSQQRDVLRSRLAAIDFTYSDPHPGFDRSKVKGMVANLVGLDQQKYESSMALEICAGGKLYNIVVADDQTGSSLIEKGRLTKRITAIPMNRISATGISADKLSNARRLAPGKVDSALSLIDYSQDVAGAMAYVFGDTLICKDKETANKLTFNKSVGVRTVTLEGDTYEPSGALSGGSAPNSSGIIVKIQELRAIEAQIAFHRGELGKIDRELHAAKSTSDAYRKAKRELDLKQHEVSLLEQQVHGSSSAKLIAEVDELREELSKLRAIIAGAKDKQKEAQAECKRLEKEMADFKNNKDAKLDEIKADIAHRKKEVAKQTAAIKARQKEVQTAELEIEQLEADVETAKGEVDEAKASSVKVKSKLAALESAIASQQIAHGEAEAKLKAERAILNSFDEELTDLENDLKQKKQEIADVELAVKKAEHDLASLVKEQSGASSIIEGLEKQFTWIKEESRYFGKPGTPYDFDGVNLAETREKTREMEAQHKSLGRKVNKSVMTMIDSVEKKEQELKKNMKTVLGDRQKIEGAIAELDMHKRQALESTWQKVNSDFGPIFAELLPGNFAKLQPPEGQDITQGLEVKVRLGSVWKASLTELSGGQRSLIALSLIMSLLQFKPAPMYILDEIDSALDLSHTQHIGQLFRSRFKGSQFIVVSLKEGLFTNANVLFRARFRDGTSVVERTVTRSGHGQQAIEDKENHTETAGKSGAKKIAPGRTARAPLAQV